MPVGVEPRTRARTARGFAMEFRLEMVTVPVSDVDRAKSFYVDQLGFALTQDVQVDSDHRFVELAPPGSACSIALTAGYVDSLPGSLGGAVQRRRRRPRARLPTLIGRPYLRRAGVSVGAVLLLLGRGRERVVGSRGLKPTDVSDRTPHRGRPSSSAHSPESLRRARPSTARRSLLRLERHAFGLEVFTYRP